MAGLDLSQPLLGAGASAKCDFAAAQVRTGLDFDLDLQFKRGAKLEVGLAAYADASAEFSKFIRASIEGTAFAEARAGVQLQLPLNLFDEFGFSARAEAIAQAAAGLEANLGLSIGDFVALAKRDPNLIGAPLEIFMLFLEEVSIGGGFEVNVSASAKAHASISVTGIIIEKAGEKAGFYYTVDAGAGLGAGVGMGIKAGLEFKDFRRFFGRAVDVSVDKTIADIIQLLPADLKMQATGEDLKPWLQVFSPVAKVALRTAYDVGMKISQNNPGGTQNDMASLCNEAIKTFLEEAQRFIFGKLLESGADALRKLFEQQATHMGAAAWDALLVQRTDLSEQLLATPPEPFQNTPENIQYWKDLVSKTLALITATGSADPKLKLGVSILYATSELLLEAVRAKVNVASAYATAIGARTVNADTQPFSGPLVNQPDASIKIVIAGANRGLNFGDLVVFLVSSAVVDPALSACPELKGFVDLFWTDFQKTGKEVLGLVLQNAASFDLASPGNAQSDPHALLSKIVLALNGYITGRFRAEVLPVVLEHISDPNLRLYIQEVLFEAVVYMKDVGLKSLLAWNDPGRSFDNDEFTEALAGVMMLLLGRTVIITGDTLMNGMQEKAQVTCNALADKVKAGHPDVRRFEIPPELLKIAEDCLRVGGEVLGPLPEETRARMRRLLYQVFEPIPPGGEQSFLESLADDFFIPNEADLRLVTDELTTIAKERFVLFAQKFILRIGEYILELLEEFIMQIVDMVVNWERTLAAELNNVAQLLRQLEARIVQVNAEVIELFVSARNAVHSLLLVLSGPDLQSKLKTEIKSKFVDKALDALEDNGVYKYLPGNIKSAVRGLVGGAVSAAMNNPVINPVFAAVNAVAGQLDSLLPDVRELDPEGNLPEQMMELILDKIEQNIRSHFDGGKPGISLTIDYTYSVWVLDDIFGNGHWETRHIYVSLGRIEINLNPLIDAVRSAIHALDFYHDALDSACFKLADALAKELELAATKLERDKKKAKKDKVERILEEHNNDPKEIAILSPVSLEHFTSAIDCKIHLGGVPISYLGLDEAEASRVLIYVNSHLVPVKSLIVEESLSVKDEDMHKEDIDLGRVLTVLSVGAGVGNVNGATGSFRNSKVHIITDTSGKIPSQTTNKINVSRGKEFSFSNAAMKEDPVARNVYMAGAKSGAGKIQLSRDIGKDKKGRSVNRYRFDNLRPGGLKPASNLQDVLNDRLPGILIQFRAQLDEPFVVEGVNVVTVVVIEKEGNRHQQSVSFTVGNPPLIKKPGRRGIEMPGFIDPKKNFSINNVVRSRIESAEDIATNEIREEMEKRVGKSVKQPVIASGTSVRIENPVITKTVKKEVISIRDKTGKEIAKHELEYSNASEKLKKMRSLKVDSKKLAAEGKSVKSEKVSYSRVEVPRGRAKAFDAKPLLNLHEAGIREQMESSLRYLGTQHQLNFKKFQPDNLPL